MPDKRTTLGIKLLFAAVILWQPIQYAFESRFGEAYPFLQLPSFGGTLTDDAGNIQLQTVDVEVSFKDGTKSKISSADLLSQVASAYRQPIMTHMFGPVTQPSAPAGNSRWQSTKAMLFPALVARRAKGGVRDLDPETKRWLENRLLVLYPSKHATALTFFWRTNLYHIAGSSVAITPQNVAIREASLAEP